MNVYCMSKKELLRLGSLLDEKCKCPSYVKDTRKVYRCSQIIATRNDSYAFNLLKFSFHVIVVVVVSTLLIVFPFNKVVQHFNLYFRMISLIKMKHRLHQWKREK